MLRRNRSLSARLTRRVLGVVAVSIIALSFTLLAGLDRFAVNEEAADLAMHVQAFRVALIARLAVVDSALVAVATSAAEGKAGERVLSEMCERGDGLEQLAVLTPEGDVLAASGDRLPPRFQGTGDRRLALEAGALWQARLAPDGSSVVAMVEPESLRRVVVSARPQRPWGYAWVTDQSGALVAGRSPKGRVVEGGEPGTAHCRVEDGAVVRCAFVDFEPVEGVRWRAWIADEPGGVLHRSWRALAPAGLVALAIAAVSVGAAQLFGQRLVGPLRRLEAAARIVAAGGYAAPPPPTGEGDEVDRLTESMNALAQRVNALQDLSRLLASAEAEDEMLEAILGATDRIMATGRVSLYLCSGQGVVLARAVGDAPENGGRVVLEAAETAEPVSERGAEASVLAAPLVLSGDVLGVVRVAASPDRRFSDAEVDVLRAFSAQAAIALRSSQRITRAHQARQRARSRALTLETLLRVSHAVSAPLELDEVVGTVLDLVEKILSADAVLLLRYEPGRGLTLAATRGLLVAEDAREAFVPGEGLLGRVFASGAAEMAGEGLGEGDPLAPVASRLGLESAVAVPLLARGRATGVLAAFAVEPCAFAAEDQDLIAAFAAQAALAVDTADLYGREHRVATVLKESVAPDRLPDIGGLDVASIYSPAGTEADIGGDYYDMFLAPDGRIVVAIGDVCGKGVVAAAKTTMVKYSLRGLVSAGLDPARAVSELNRAVTATGDPSDIVTLWLGFLDLGGNEMRYVNAGHPAALLLQPDAHVVRLPATGPLLGASMTASYAEEGAHMPEGATLLLYTDGVTEARGAGRFFGEGRVERSLRRRGTASEVADRLAAAVRAYAGDRLRDDAAMLVVRRTEAAGGEG